MSDISASAIEDVVIGLNTIYGEFLDDDDKEYSQATALRLAVELINTLSARRDQLETFNDEAEQAIRFWRQRVAEMTRALEARDRLLNWCRPRLKQDAYRAALDGYRAEMPKADHTPVISNTPPAALASGGSKA